MSNERKYKGIDIEKIKEVQRVKLPHVDARYVPTEERFKELIEANEIEPIRNTIDRHYRSMAKNEELYIICEMALMYLDSLEERDKLIKQLHEDGYKEGLVKAWRIAQKLAKPSTDGGFTIQETFGIFDNISCNYVLRNYTITDVIEKIEIYKKKISDFKVGDVVIHNKYGRLFVIHIRHDSVAHVMDSNGEYFGVHKDALVKTGEHIDIQDHIENILNQLKGDRDE